ncbi:hypothetical protein [Dactylosporangium sp. CA-092794]|uniref:hypothetical protein n=1 Tax=Dactylosporangium sp. CA-092794 TaxID=3239929 RepID=UPI003D8BCE4B
MSMIVMTAQTMYPTSTKRSVSAAARVQPGSLTAAIKPGCAGTLCGEPAACRPT